MCNNRRVVSRQVGTSWFSKHSKKCSISCHRFLMKVSSFIDSTMLKLPLWWPRTALLKNVVMKILICATTFGKITFRFIASTCWPSVGSGIPLIVLGDLVRPSVWLRNNQFFLFALSLSQPLHWLLLPSWLDCGSTSTTTELTDQYWLKMWFEWYTIHRNGGVWLLLTVKYISEFNKSLKFSFCFFTCRSDHLKLHMKVHETGKCYQCASCLKTYMTSAALTSHMMLHKKLSESSIRDLRCQQCGDKMTSTEELQVRLEYFFSCFLCILICILFALEICSNTFQYFSSYVLEISRPWWSRMINR